MGEIANDMIEGRCCSLCGQYFISNETILHGSIPDIVVDPNDADDYQVMYEHGYPVVCEECWEEDCGYQKAITETL